MVGDGTSAEQLDKDFWIKRAGEVCVFVCVCQSLCVHNTVGPPLSVPLVVCVALYTVATEQ